MNKLFIITLISFFAFNCRQQRNGEVFKKFSQYFPESNNDTLYVSVCRAPDSSFCGRKLPDTLFFNIIDSADFTTNLKKWCNSCSLDEFTYYAVKKFIISDLYIGCVIRTQTSDIMFQKTDLFIFDKKNGLPVQCFMLAEFKGSESEYDQTDSWILRNNDDKYPFIISFNRYSYQASADSLVIKDSIYKRRWNNSHLIYVEDIIPGEKELKKQVSRLKGLMKEN